MGLFDPLTLRLFIQITSGFLRLFIQITSKFSEVIQKIQSNTLKSFVYMTSSFGKEQRKQ